MHDALCVRRAAFGEAECGRRRLRRRPLRPSAFADGRAPRSSPAAALKQHLVKHEEFESRGGRRRGASQADLRSKAAASSSGGVRTEPAKVQIRRHGGFCYPRNPQNHSKTPPSAHTSPPHARRAAFGFAECGRRRLSPPPFAPVRFRERARAAQFPPAISAKTQYSKTHNRPFGKNKRTCPRQVLLLYLRHHRTERA